MDTSTFTTQATLVEHSSLPDALRLGPVALAVTDLARSVAFYERSIGLEQIEGPEGSVALLGTGGVRVLELHEEPAATRAGRHAGLYHVALLYPSRLELAREAARLAATQTVIQGASDHHTHEAIYLADPDGNGLELAADRPKDQWPSYADADLDSLRPDPLDLQGLLGLVAGEPVHEHAAAGVTTGHLHLHVGDIAAAARFYVDIIGFDSLIQASNMLFVSAGGYHHHLGVNTWQGEGALPAPPSAVGLRSWVAYVPETDDLRHVAERLEGAGVEYTLYGDHKLVVNDPWGHELHLRVDPLTRTDG